MWAIPIVSTEYFPTHKRLISELQRMYPDFGNICVAFENLNLMQKLKMYMSSLWLCPTKDAAIIHHLVLLLLLLLPALHRSLLVLRVHQVYHVPIRLWGGAAEVQNSFLEICTTRFLLFNGACCKPGSPWPQREGCFPPAWCCSGSALLTPDSSSLNPGWAFLTSGWAPLAAPLSSQSLGYCCSPSLPQNSVWDGSNRFSYYFISSKWTEFWFLNFSLLWKIEMYVQPSLGLQKFYKIWSECFPNVHLQF